MMIQTEDGQKLQVPDGYGPADIDEVLNHYQAALAAPAAPVQQMDGPLRDPAIIASGLDKGIAATAGLPGDAVSLADKYVLPDTRRSLASGLVDALPDGAANFLGGMKPDALTPPTSAQTLDENRRLGLIDRPDLQPQTTGERYLAAGAQGVGSAVPLMLTGGAAAPLLAAQGAGSGVAGQAAADAGAGPWGQFAASMLGGGIAGGVQGVGARLANRAAGELSPVAQAYQDIGVTPQLAGNATDSNFLKWAQNRGAELPVSGGMVKKAGTTELQGFGNAVDDFAGQFGKSQTLQDAGTALQQGAKDWLQNFKTTSGNVWDGVNQAVGANTPASLTNTENAIGAIKNQAPNNPQLQRFLDSKLAGDVSGIISETKGNFKPGYIDPNTNLLVPSSGKAASPLNWGQMQKLRSRVGEYLEDPQSIPDAGTAQAKQLYGALSQDMKNTALLSGNPQALPLFNAANEYTKGGHAFVENALSGILGPNINPENAANYALSSGRLGGSVLGDLRQQMPGAVNELTAAKLRSAAQALPGVQDAAGTVVSPSRFLTEMGGGGKMSPEARDALLPQPQDQSKLNSFNTVASSIRDTEKLANNSKTATAALPLAMFEGAAQGAKWLGGKFPGGALAGGALGAAAPLAVGYPFGALATNKALISLMSGAPRQAQSSYPALAALAAAAVAGQR